MATRDADHDRSTNRADKPSYYGLSKVLWELPADTPVDELPEAIAEYREEHDV